MQARLFALTGPLKGTTVPIGAEDVGLGRVPSNRVCILNWSVSRQHCVIRHEEDGFLLSDLDSRNGTFVNDLPIKEHKLRSGDRISVGGSTFVFLLEGEEVQDRDKIVHFAEANESSLSTATVRVGEAVYFQPDKLLKSDVSPQLTRNLSALLRIATKAGSALSSDELYRLLLSAVFEVCPAETAAILVPDSGDAFTCFLAMNRKGEEDIPVEVSRASLLSVLRDQVAMLTPDVAPRIAKDATGSPIRDPGSLIYAPLQVHSKVIGIVALHNGDRNNALDRGHLEVVSAMVRIAELALERIRYVERMQKETRLLQASTGGEREIIGESPAMQQVYQVLSRVAASDSTVLLLGESGTGKELAARSIHVNSARSESPFVAVNCATLGEALIESELFGHEKGAFTGAIAAKKGQFESAEGGTIFLDEVGELPPQLQAKLLRVLQEKEFFRVGGTRSISVNARLIAATNKNLSEAVQAGTFRRDLFYRLNVVSLTLPALRDRREDIPLLTSYFISKCSKKCKRFIKGISAATRQYLLAYDWPGNVRELENVIERAIVLGVSDEIAPEDLPDCILEQHQGTPERPIAAYHQALATLKRQLIVSAVNQSNGNYTEAAKLLGIHPNYLHRLIRNLDLRAALGKASSE